MTTAEMVALSAALQSEMSRRAISLEWQDVVSSLRLHYLETFVSINFTKDPFIKQPYWIAAIGDLLADDDHGPKPHSPYHALNLKQLYAGDHLLLRELGPP